MTKAKNIKIYQIYYDQASKEKLDPNFIALDNSANQRPDWCEYWPIRNVLLNEHFEADTYIGFFSPKFFAKTSIDAEKVISIVNASNAEVISFSPLFAHNAFFLNSFIQGEAAHPGLLKLTKKLLIHLNIDIEIESLVCDQTTTIFSNYFVAKYEFWLIWFSFAEKLFQLCENTGGEFADNLVSNTRHESADGTPMKVFIMERLITLVLELSNISAQMGVDIDIKNISHSGFKTALDLDKLIICDALKSQFRKTKMQIYLDAFYRNKEALILLYRK